MRTPIIAAIAMAAGIAACTTTRSVSTDGTAEPGTPGTTIAREGPSHLPQAIGLKEFPRIPEPDAAAAWVPDGWRVEVVCQGLIYPTTVEVDPDGDLYVAEAGYVYGDLVAPARVLRIARDGRIEVLADGLNGPVNDLLWDDGRLYVSHRGKVSVLEGDGRVRDLVTDLPSSGDHHNNQLARGPDGKIYFGQGTATNSGIVGIDNIYPFLWLTMFPDVCDVPAFDVELEGKTFTSPDPLTVIARQGEPFASRARRSTSSRRRSRSSSGPGPSSRSGSPPRASAARSRRAGRSCA